VSLNGQEKEIIMSVWKQVKSDVLGKNVNERLLVQALSDLGITIDKTVKSIRNSWGNDTCDFALTNNGVVYTSSNGASWTSTGYTSKNRCLTIWGDPESGYFYDFQRVIVTNSTGRQYNYCNIYRSSDCKTWTLLHSQIDTGVS
jgi:hypothetical protein